MTGSFLDTTVLVDLAEECNRSPAIKAFIATNQPAEVPYYALRELLTGRVRVLCDAHNKLNASDTLAECLLAFSSMPPIAGRKKDGAIHALAKALEGAFSTNPNGNRSELKRELLQSLSIAAVRLWRNANRAKGCSLVQSLACFNAGDLSRGESGEIRGPSQSFNCIRSERCAAAGYIYDNAALLSKLIQSLHPDNLDETAAGKNENKQRRKALKELKASGGDRFDKRLCRALGDAYFAAMCPAGSKVLTTNAVDHEILCAAVGKKVASI